MKINKTLSCLLLATSLLAASHAQASDSPWMLRFRALKVAPDVKSTNQADGTNSLVKINSDTVPELDITYFFTKNIASELILGTSTHNVKALPGEADLGRVSLLPPTLTLQYHFSPETAFRPYVGAGVNYTIFYNKTTNNSTYYDVNYQNSFGYAFQAGFDYMFDDKFGINFDVKKIYLSTNVSINHGAVRTKVDLDPWLFGVGAVYKF